MLLVSMQYLLRLYAIPGRLLLTIHDEVRYLVPKAYELHMAACLQVANIWTRAMFVHRVGMRELPLSVAFFSAVDLDQVLRKEPTIGCQTPSQPEAIPPGRSIDVWQLLKELPNGLGKEDAGFKAWWEARRGVVQWRPGQPAITVPPLDTLRHQTGITDEPPKPKTDKPSKPATKPANDVPREAEQQALSQWKRILKSGKISKVSSDKTDRSDNKAG